VVKILHRKFYNRPTLTVARELIGARLVRILDGVKLVGLITETDLLRQLHTLLTKRTRPRAPARALL